MVRLWAGVINGMDENDTDDVEDNAGDWLAVSFAVEINVGELVGECKELENCVCEICSCVGLEVNVDTCACDCTSPESAMATVLLKVPVTAMVVVSRTASPALMATEVPVVSPTVLRAPTASRSRRGSPLESPKASTFGCRSAKLTETASMTAKATSVALRMRSPPAMSTGWRTATKSSKMTASDFASATATAFGLVSPEQTRDWYFQKSQASQGTTRAKPQGRQFQAKLRICL